MDKNKSQVISHKSQDISRRLSVDRLMGVRLEKGTAFILVVMLVALLAVIGTMFLLRARVGRLSASAMRQNSELNNAADTVVAAISQQLIVDTPGVDVDSNGVPRREYYYDYPDANNAWLANLEPFLFSDNGTPNDSTDDIYHWRQISDVTGYLRSRGFQTQQVPVDPTPLTPFGSQDYIDNYPALTLTKVLNNDLLNEHWADADGDGIADSKWIELADITTGRGEPVFAAVRVVDNGGMLNVNTAYKFDPNSTDPNEIDGSSQLQINFLALAGRDDTHTAIGEKKDRLWFDRCGTTLPLPQAGYEDNVIWQYNNPTVGYTPFDISDELKLRNRYLLNFNEITTRIEKLWTNAYDGGPGVPLESTGTYKYSDSNSTKNDWLKCATFIEPNFYDYRHITTTYNMDRIINPRGKKMFNINHLDPNSLFDAVYAGFRDAGYQGAQAISEAEQITANMIDYIDNDSNVTIYSGKVGFERPCVYISELAYLSISEPNKTYNHYAIELYKPYFEDDDPVEWVLDIDGQRMPIDWSAGSRRFYVRFFADINDPNADIAYNINFPDVDESDNLYDPNNYRGLVDDFNDIDIGKFYSYHFVSGSSISLLRPVNGQYIVVDQHIVPSLPDPNKGVWSIQRDISPHKCIRRLWNNAALPGHTLGMKNNYNYFDLVPNIIQAHPKNAPLTTIGELGMILRKSAYLTADPNFSIGKTDTKETVLVNLANLIYQQLFNYLTVIDPNSHGRDADEVRVQGRININTAPWYVLAQLPWVSSHTIKADGTNNYDLAKAIVAYRDKTAFKLPPSDGIDYSGRGGNLGFENIGQLNNVDVNSNSGSISPNIHYFGLDNSDQKGFPDITPVKEFEPGDGAADDFEERDLIFARISDLVTVRSDVFTAYILVRLGEGGPQKRVMAILDRSEVRNDEMGTPDDRTDDKIIGNVKIRSLYPVPDPR